MSTCRISLFVLLFISFSHLSAQKNFIIENIMIPTRDSIRLQGKFYKSSNIISLAVLLIHQCDIDPSKDKTGFEEIAESLAHEGIHVMIYFQRGYSKSISGTSAETNSSSRGHDAEDVFTYLSTRSDVDKTRIALGGASCGGRACASITKNFTVRGILLLSVAMGQPFLELLQKQSAPLLCIASQDDQSAYQASLKSFTDSKNSHSKLIVVKGPVHGWPILNADPHIISDVTSFYKGILSDR